MPLIYLHILKQSPSLKRLGLISWGNNDDIGICKIWRKHGKFHQFELQSETKDDHQQSRKLRKCLSRSRCRKPKRVYFKSLNLKKLLLLKKINNRGNIIQLQKETAYLPPSCSLLRESGAVRSTLNCFYICRHSRHEPVIFSFPTHDTEIKTLKIYHIPTYRAESCFTLEIF